MSESAIRDLFTASDAAVIATVIVAAAVISFHGYQSFRRRDYGLAALRALMTAVLLGALVWAYGGGA